MRYAFLVSLVFIHSLLNAQSFLKGTVVDIETKKPIQGASVYLTNTSIGTVTSPDGTYELRLPQGRYDVVFAFTGYETKVIPSGLTDSFRIVKLKPKSKDLEDIEVFYDKDGWENWGKFFLENFIGTTEYSEDCKIKNESVLRFRKDKPGNTLIAIAKEPLIIVNKALGYNIKYQLETFAYNFRTQQLHFEGYPLFEEMNGNARQVKRWFQNRKNVYEGSQMHFMRSVFRNVLEENGFEVHRLIKVDNTEKEKARKEMPASGKPVVFDNALGLPDKYDILYSAKLTGDSIAFAIDSVTAGMAFSDYLHITYTKKRAPSKYLLTFPKSRAMTSQVTMLQADGIAIQSNGSFYPPAGIMSLGYWAWSEKIGTMLPFNFRPR
jgi:hypothetical protein